MAKKCRENRYQCMTRMSGTEIAKRYDSDSELRRDREAQGWRGDGQEWAYRQEI